MQLTNDTRQILGDEKGELKEHFVSVTRKELNDPSINICASVRWLHHKRKLLSSKLKREATWEETINAYKGGGTVTPERAKELLGRVYENLEVLKKKIGLLFLTFFSLSCVPYPVKTSSFISRSIYDYDLLGEGFGIIGREDIAINDCQLHQVHFR